MRNHITPDMVVVLKTTRAETGFSYEKLGQLFGFGHNAVFNAINNRTYKAGSQTRGVVPRDPTDRFLEKVDKTPGLGPNGDCWIGTGARGRWGYGNFITGSKAIKGDRRTHKAHRYSWQTHRGAIPDDLNVLHRCDNPSCVNPNHLFLGTQADNCRDRDMKGRGRWDHLEPTRFKRKIEGIPCSDMRDKLASTWLDAPDGSQAKAAALLALNAYDSGKRPGSEFDKTARGVR